VKAPASMKSVVLAGWLLTTACGNLFDVVVTSARVISQVLFIGALVDTVIILSLGRSRRHLVASSSLTNFIAR